MFFVHDIETIEDETAVPLIEDPRPPAHYRDQSKIDAYIAEKKADRKLALDPSCCRIVCIGGATPLIDGGEPFALLCKTVDEERTHLEWLVDQLRRATVVVGFNCVSFDLAVIVQRCRLLGVDPPQISLNKYRPGKVVDLLQMLSFEGAQPMRSLKFWARRFGIPVNDTLAGSDIGGLVAAGEWDLISLHCKSDVALTLALATRLGVVTPQPELQGVGNDIPF